MISAQLHLLQRRLHHHYLKEALPLSNKWLQLNKSQRFATNAEQRHKNESCGSRSIFYTSIIFCFTDLSLNNSCWVETCCTVGTLPNPLVTGCMCLPQAFQKVRNLWRTGRLVSPYFCNRFKDAKHTGMTACSQSGFLKDLYCDLSIRGQPLLKR